MGKEKEWTSNKQGGSSKFAAMKRLLLLVFVGILLSGCDDKETRMKGFLLKGNEALKTDDPEKALYYYKEALKLDECFSDALNNAGTIQHNMGNHQGAIEMYTKAIECKPDYLEARFNRANTYYESGEYFAAIADIDAIVKQKPDTAAVYFLKGLVMTRQRDYVNAHEAFEKALSLKPVRTLELDCRVNLASVKMFLKRYDEAKKELIQCIDIDSTEPNIFNSLALIAIEEKDYEWALVQINKALDIQEDQPYYVNNRGFIYIKLNQLDKALADIDRSITLDPYNAWAYRNKGILQLEKKDYVSAERLLKRAVEMDKAVEQTHYYLGLVYQNTNRAKEACEEFVLSNKAGEELVKEEQLKKCK